MKALELLLHFQRKKAGRPRCESFLWATHAWERVWRSLRPVARESSRSSVRCTCGGLEVGASHGYVGYIYIYISPMTDPVLYAMNLWIHIYPPSTNNPSLFSHQSTIHTWIRHFCHINEAGWKSTILGHLRTSKTHLSGMILYYHDDHIWSEEYDGQKMGCALWFGDGYCSHAEKNWVF